ncbi:predicted protein [Streptomyces sp. SPB78]|uniref:hypothetical protein n=1 Tax=Streptomyces sp. (strain SPB78) TaxID=591157 RepID=UPI0001B553AD|nr:hypothetical protein [Streptomyces sp. SPB78]EFK99539.1 predicted protein [Streptomyces sp. SPB78]
MDPQTPQTPPTPESLAVMRMRAAYAAGLTLDQADRLNGTTEEEFAADAANFVASFTPPAPNPQSGGARGVDVGSTGGGVAAGAARFRDRHPEPAERPANRQTNPFAERTYSMESR